MDSALVNAVLDVVDTIPRGRVVSYGDIARHLELGSARLVGRVMAYYGHEVEWQRVVMADGSPASHKPGEHLARLRADGVPIKNDRVDMTRARYELPAATAVAFARHRS